MAEQPAASARFALRVTSMHEVFPEPIRGWLRRSPKARRAVKRLSDDLDAVVAWLESATRGELRDAIAARIDPPSKAAAASEDAGPALPDGSVSQPPPSGTTR